MTGLIESEVRRVLAGDTEMPSAHPQVQHDMGSRFKIVIAQRGFVFAGECHFEGSYVVLERAVNIRRWGTTKGLGQLASEGKQTETKADYAGTVRLHELAIVAMMDCKGEIGADS